MQRLSSLIVVFSTTLSIAFVVDAAALVQITAIFRNHDYALSVVHCMSYHLGLARTVTYAYPSLRLGLLLAKRMFLVPAANFTTLKNTGDNLSLIHI